MGYFPKLNSRVLINHMYIVNKRYLTGKTYILDKHFVGFPKKEDLKIKEYEVPALKEGGKYKQLELKCISFI